MGAGSNIRMIMIRMIMGNCGKRRDRVFQAEGTGSAKALGQSEVGTFEEGQKGWCGEQGAVWEGKVEASGQELCWDSKRSGK